MINVCPPCVKDSRPRAEILAGPWICVPFLRDLKAIIKLSSQCPKKMAGTVSLLIFGWMSELQGYYITVAYCVPTTRFRLQLQTCSINIAEGGHVRQYWSSVTGPDIRQSEKRTTLCKMFLLIEKVIQFLRGNYRISIRGWNKVGVEVESDTAGKKINRPTLYSTEVEYRSLISGLSREHQQVGCFNRSKAQDMLDQIVGIILVILRIPSNYIYVGVQVKLAHTPTGPKDHNVLDTESMLNTI